MINEDRLAASRWWRIMPVIFVTFSLAFLDRVNYSFASVAGIDRDLGITAGTSSLIGAVFFLGYFLFQIPGTVYAERHNVKKLIFWSLMLWGCFSALTGVVSNIPALMVLRFCLGVVEAAVFPALLLLINKWFTRRERSIANTLVCLGNPITTLWMSVVSGYLVDGFGWRMMFVLEGVPAMIWAVTWWFLVEETPANVKWLTAQQKTDIEVALAREQKQIKPVRNYAEAFRSASVIKLALQYFFWSIGLFGFVFWLPSILRQGSGSSMIATGWLSAAPYMFSTIAMLIVSVISDRLLVRKHFVWPCLFAGAFAFTVLFAYYPLPFWVSYALLTIAGVAMLAPIAAFFAIPPELLPKNVAGGASALINSMGALGAFVGSYFVGQLNGWTNSPAYSFLLMGTALFIAVALSLSVKTELHVVREEALVTA